MIYKFIYHLLLRKVTIAKWQLNVFGILFILIGIVFGSFLTINGLSKLFALTNATIIKETDTDFSQGTLNSTIISGTGDTAKLTLPVGEYKKQLTFNNSGSALSDYQVLIDEGEVAHWKMDETSGTNVADSSGNNLNLAANNTTINSGNYGNARSFNGNSSYLSVTDSPDLTPKSAITVGAWINTSNPTSYFQYIVSKDPTNSLTGYGLRFDGTTGSVSFLIGNGTSYNQAKSVSTISSNTWTYVVGTYDGTNIRMYINGNLERTVAFTGNIPTNSFNFNIGRRISDASFYFIGLIDEVRIYKRALTTTEILYLYTNNKSPILNTLYDHAQESGNDIRFKDSDDSTNLPYWIENFTASGQNAKIWVKVPSIGANTTKTINMYYGSGGSAQSDGQNTFNFFDDFSGSNLDNTKWISDSSGGSEGSIAVNNSIATLMKGPSSNSYAYLKSIATFGTDIVVETKAKSAGAFTGLHSFIYGGLVSDFSGNPNDNAEIHDILNIRTYDTGAYVTAGTGGLQTNNAITAWTANVFNKFSVIRTSSSTVIGKVNGVTVSTVSTNMPSLSSQLYLYLKIGNVLNYTHDTNTRYMYYDWVFVHKYSATEPILSSVSSETPIVSASGTWTSATDSNVIDTIWNGGWGDGVDGSSTAFFANVSNINSATNDTITFEMKTASSVSDLATATYKTLGTTQNTDTTFTKTKTDLDALNLNTGLNRYIQVKVTINQASGTSPMLDNFTIYYQADNTGPETNASEITMLRSGGGTNVAYDTWTKGLSPYFSWTQGNDTQSGVKGYCLYLGDSPSGNPATSKGLLGTSPESIADTTCRFVVSGTNINFATSSYKGVNWFDPTITTDYYLNIKAIDNNNNIALDSASFLFHFDNLPPTNLKYISCSSGSFSNVVDMNFNWPTDGTAAASDAESNILGWQYQINSTSGTWLGTTTETLLGINNYIPKPTSEMFLTQGQDGNSINYGNNTVYFRSIDIAGNVSGNDTIRTCNLAYGGDAPIFGGSDIVTVSPQNASENSYDLSWPEANPATGRTVTHYYYMLNTTPPSTYDTLIGNPTTYIDNGTNLIVPAGALPNVNKDANIVRVVAVDDLNNYSPSNYIEGNFTLSSSIPDNVGNLVASDSSIKSQSQWNVTLTWVAPVYQGAGNLTYIIKRSTDNFAFTEVGSTSGLAYVDNTPTSSKYYYIVYTKDGADLISSGTNAVEITPTGKWTSAPELNSDPKVTNITTRRATITWSTSRGADSKVQYGTKSNEYGDVEPSESSSVTTHSIILTGLNPGTTYYYKAKWTDEDGNTGKSEEKSFKTAQAPSVLDVSVENINLSSGLIKYTVKGAAKVKLYYGTSTNFGGIKEIFTASDKTTYTTLLSGLQDGTKYYYKINTFDSESAEYEGTILNFTTLPRPKISEVRLEAIANTAQTTVRVTWTSNTEINSIVTYYPEYEPNKSIDETNIAFEQGAHSLIIRKLLAQTKYLLVVKGQDKLGNEATSDPQSFTTATDTRPPEVLNLKVIGGTIPPVGYAAGEIKAQLVITWDTDEPATSQVEFGQGSGTSYSAKSQFDGNLTTNHTVILSGLIPSQVYHLRTLSQDGTGNLSQSSDLVTIAPKATRSALELVIQNLSEAFGFISGTGVN